MGEQTLSRARAEGHRAGEILPAADTQASGDFTAALVLADGTVLRGQGFEIGRASCRERVYVLV